MPKFSYIIKDNEGKAYKNVIDANSQAALVDTLQKQGYFIVSIKELSSGHSRSKTQQKKKKRFTHKKVKLTDLLIFSRQLATMLEAGVSLIRTLDVILLQINSESLHQILSTVRKDVERGETLSKSIAKYPKIFNQFWISLIEVGETSGSIPAVLNKLAFYLEQQERFRSTIISGLIYPAILFCVSMGAIAFFALFVGPRFEDIFNQMGAQLPPITTALLATFKFVKTNFLLLVGSFIATIIVLRQYGKTYSGKIMFEKFMYQLPAFGETYKLIVVERFTSQMGILIETGVPILQALDIAERLVNNNTCGIIVNDIKEGVRKGEHIVAPMERSGFFPAMAVQMIMVGEETGELSKMLNHVSKFYQEQVETFMKRFATIVEPFMLVFMGGVIGVIVVAMFLPLFNVSQFGGGG